MLLPRILTALALVALLLPALVSASPWPFAVLTLGLLGAAGWEWGRLNGLHSARGALGLAAAVVLACLVAWRAGWTLSAPAMAWWFATLAWLLGGAWALWAGPARWPGLPQVVRLLMGLVVLWAGWLALASAQRLGVGFILSSLCIVWMADIAAYAGGRLLGRHKLAPSISPGKTWEGVVSGAVGVQCLGWGWLALGSAGWVSGNSVFSVLLQGLGVGGLVLALVGLTGFSVMGDLVESLIKRAVGAKDSSRLLPGHGGVLDRIDALLPTLPAVMALSSWAVAR